MGPEHERAAAFELLLLVLADDASALAAVSYSEHHQLDKIRTRLGISEQQQQQLIELLFPASLARSGASALLRGLPAYRGLLWLEARQSASVNMSGSSATTVVDDFIARQRTLLLASMATGSGGASTRQLADPEDVEKTLLEGWLEKRAENHLFKPWIRRYVRLLPGRLCWAHDEEGTKARELRLDSRTVATVEPDLTLRVVCEERAVTLRLCADGDASGAASCLAGAVNDLLNQPEAEMGVMDDSAEGADTTREHARRRRGELTESFSSGRPTLHHWAEKIEGAA